jgi:hypothetical protein
MDAAIAGFTFPRVCHGVVVTWWWWWISEVIHDGMSVPIGERFGVDGHHLAEAFSCQFF